jgi:hypothetical protein
VRSQKAKVVIRAVRSIMCIFGVPIRIVSDAVATPRANGQCERYNQTIVNMLATSSVEAESDLWDTHVKELQSALNTSFNKGEEYASIVAEKWEDQCYTVTEIVEGNPLQAARDTDLTVWVKKSDDMEKGLPRMFKERYPELAELEGDRVASIEISVRYGDKEKCTSERVITRMVAEMEERDYFNDLHQLRLAMVRKGRKKVAIPKPDIGGLQRFRRMVECIFGPHGLEEIYVPRKLERSKPENKQTYKTAEEKARNKNTVLIVNEGNTEYSQLLKKIKDGVIKQGSQKAVKTLRKTKDGSLLIEVEKGEENVKCLEKIIEIETTNGKVGVSRNGGPPHQRNGRTYNGKRRLKGTE